MDCVKTPQEMLLQYLVYIWVQPACGFHLDKAVPVCSEDILGILNFSALQACFPSLSVYDGHCFRIGHTGGDYSFGEAPFELHILGKGLLEISFQYCPGIQLKNHRLFSIAISEADLPLASIRAGGSFSCC